MLDKLKQLAKMVYENHNVVIEGKINKNYEIENITMYVHQDNARISITALNNKTQRQINITAKKYSKLFKSYDTIAKISSTLKDLPKVIIELLEQEEEVKEDIQELNSENREHIYNKFIEYLKKTDNKIVDKADIVRLGEEYGIALTAKMAKTKIIDRIVESDYIERLYDTFAEFIYIPNWEVAKFYNVDTKVIDSLKVLGCIKEDTKESEFYSRTHKQSYNVLTYPISVLSKYNSEELSKAYNEAYEQEQFRIRVTTDKEEDIQKIITELRKVFIVEYDPAVYERRTKGFNNYLTIKISNNSEVEEKRYLKEIQELKTELRAEREEKYRIADKVYNAGAIKLLEKHYDKTGIELNYSIKSDLAKLGTFKEIKEDYKTEINYILGYKYSENGTVHYRDFPRMQFVNQWLEQGKEKNMIKVSLEEFEVKKLIEKNTSADDECIKYLKDKFGEDYINKTKMAIEQLEKEKKRRSLAGRKAKFDENQIDKILELRETGKTIKELSEIFNCGVATIHKLISEKK